MLSHRVVWVKMLPKSRRLAIRYRRAIIEMCARGIDDAAHRYRVDVFSEPDQARLETCGQVDNCSANTLRWRLRALAEEIREFKGG
jgi:hypothetical protein